MIQREPEIQCYVVDHYLLSKYGVLFRRPCDLGVVIRKKVFYIRTRCQTLQLPPYASTYSNELEKKIRLLRDLSPSETLADL